LTGLRGAVDEFLGLLEAEAGDRAHLLDDADLVGTGLREDDGEFGLLDRRGGRSGTASSRDSGGRPPRPTRPTLASRSLTRACESRIDWPGQPLDDLVFGDVAHGVLLEEA
jgi:hypothetical protein